MIKLIQNASTFSPENTFRRTFDLKTANKLAENSLNPLYQQQQNQNSALGRYNRVEGLPTMKLTHTTLHDMK